MSLLFSYLNAFTFGISSLLVAVLMIIVLILHNSSALVPFCWVTMMLATVCGSFLVWADHTGQCGFTTAPPQYII